METEFHASAEMSKMAEGVEDDILDVVGRKKRGRPKGSLSRKGRKGDDCGTVLGTKDMEGGNLRDRAFRKTRDHFSVPVRNDVIDEVMPTILRKANRTKVEEGIREATEEVTMDGPTGVLIELKQEESDEALEQINTMVDLNLLEVANTVVLEPRCPARCPEKTEKVQHTDRRRLLTAMAGQSLDHGLNRYLNTDQQHVCLSQQQSFRSDRNRSHNFLVESEMGPGLDFSNRRKRTRINREGVPSPTRTKCWAKSLSLSLATENLGKERGSSRNPERNFTV